MVCRLLWKLEAETLLHARRDCVAMVLLAEWVFKVDGGGERLALPDRPVGVDLCFHLVSPRHFAIVTHLPHRVVLHHSARLEGGARAALVELLALWNAQRRRPIRSQRNSSLNQWSN